MYAQLIDVQVTIRVPSAFSCQKFSGAKDVSDVGANGVNALACARGALGGQSFAESPELDATVQVFRRHLENEGISVSAVDWLRKDGQERAVEYMRLTLSGCARELNKRAWPALCEASEAAWGRWDGQLLELSQEPTWFLFYQAEKAPEVLQEKLDSVWRLQQFPSQWRALPSDAVEALEAALNGIGCVDVKGIVEFTAAGASFHVSLSKLMEFCSRGDQPWLEIQARDSPRNISGLVGESLPASQDTSPVLLARICIKESDFKRAVGSSADAIETCSPASYFL